MHSENVLNPELTPAGYPPAPDAAKKSHLWLAVHAFTFLFGVGLFIYVVYKIGYQTVLDSVSTVGWGFVLIILLNMIRHFARAATMYLAVDPEHRTFKYRSAVAARLGGEAVSFFTFTGPFLGDATKAVMLKRNLPLTQGASAVIIDNILYYFSVIVIVLVGVALLLLEVGRGNSTLNKILLAIVISAVVMFVAMAIAILFRVKPLTTAIDLFDRWGILPKFVMKRRRDILNVEENVFDFYHERRADFFIVFGISLGVHALSVAEVFFALRYLNYDPRLSTSFIIESLTKVINAVFSFIPGAIGVYEGGNGLILKTLGYTVGVGVALALVRRGAILFSTLVGVVVLLWRTAERGAQHLKKIKD